MKVYLGDSVKDCVKNFRILFNLLSDEKENAYYFGEDLASIIIGRILGSLDYICYIDYMPSDPTFDHTYTRTLDYIMQSCPTDEFRDYWIFNWISRRFNISYDDLNTYLQGQILERI